MNWRRRPARENQYPRFDRIQTIFQGLLEKLSSFFEGEGSRLIIQQSEVSYINVILFDDGVPLRDWFTFINQSPLKLESLNAIFTEVVRSETNQPIARMSYELNSVVSVPERKPAVRLAITYRGKPAGETTISARDFLFTGRERIVRRFCELTSAKAHERWGRKN
ncbi:TIGR04255 family protein [Mesorhizobium amorphae]|uniref:TIGR04255 family protein n=1 Tax=Mesorhizobium amorphae TaxID=71433 RepID=UPI0009DA6E2E